MPNSTNPIIHLKELGPYQNGSIKLSLSMVEGKRFYIVHASYCSSQNSHGNISETIEKRDDLLHTLNYVTKKIFNTVNNQLTQSLLNIVALH